MITPAGRAVDVIIPVHVLDESSFEYLQEGIGSIVQNTPRGLYTLTCVIDRGWDGTEQRLRDYQAKGFVDCILRNTGQRGFTRTCNVGLEQSDADLAMLLNMDIVVSPGWLQDLASLAGRTAAGIVGCKLLNDNGSINHAGAYGAGFHRGMNQVNNDFFTEEEVEWVTGAAFMVSKKLRDAIGNLDESYPMWGSDREYCIKAKQAGFEVWYSPVSLLHYGERSTNAEVKELFKDSKR